MHKTMGNFRQTMRKNQTNEKHGIRDKELDGLIIRWWTTKNRISELEDMSIENYPNRNTERKSLKTKNSIKELWNNIANSNTFIWSSKRERDRVLTEKIFEDIITIFSMKDNERQKQQF